MPKCCDCKTLMRRVVYSCATSPLSLFAVNRKHTWGCYEPRETPLLVDDLADELCKAIEVIEAYAPNDPARDSGNEALERYLRDPGRAEGFRARALAQQKEVSDGEDM